LNPDINTVIPAGAERRAGTQATGRCPSAAKTCVVAPDPARQPDERGMNTERVKNWRAIRASRIHADRSRPGTSDRLESHSKDTMTQRPQAPCRRCRRRGRRTGAAAQCRLPAHGDGCAGLSPSSGPRSSPARNRCGSSANICAASAVFDLRSFRRFRGPGVICGTAWV